MAILPKTCFLIDDDDRDIFQFALEQLDSGVNCVTANNGMVAIERLRSGQLNPDYIFLDLNMPILTGRECLIEIRKIYQFQKTPVVIYTTTSVPKDKEDLMKLDATWFITKPGKVSALITVLKEVFTAS